MVILKAITLNKQQTMFFPLLRLITNPIAALTTIHAEFGDLVPTRFFNKKLLFICRPEHLEEVFAHEGKGLMNRDFLYPALKPVFADGLINSKNDLWGKQRRLMQPLFTKEAVAAWSALMITETDRFVAQLKNSDPVNINLSVAMKSLIQTIFINILFGRSVETHNDRQLFQAIDTIGKGLLTRIATETLGKGKLNLLFMFQNRRMEKAIKHFMAFVAKEVELKKHIQTDHDLISLLIQATDKKTGYRMPEALVQDEAINLFFAGQDTTISSLSWFFYLLAKHSDVHKKITEEVHQYQNDPLTPENLEKLPYTKAALYESLRLYPPAQGLIRQALEDIEIGGQFISKGTAVILSIYATHRHDQLWERPNAFYPEHFLKASTTERHKYAFLPFGGGIHNCIGRHFAELEMMIIIVSVLRAFTLSTDATVKAAPGITLKPDRDVIIALTPLFP